MKHERSRSSYSAFPQGSCHVPLALPRQRTPSSSLEENTIDTEEYSLKTPRITRRLLLLPCAASRNLSESLCPRHRPRIRWCGAMRAHLCRIPPTAAAVASSRCAARSLGRCTQPRALHAASALSSDNQYPMPVTRSTRSNAPFGASPRWSLMAQYSSL